MTVDFIITRDTATPALAEAAASLTPQRMAAAVGPACARVVNRHLRSLGTNKRGWPSTHFWADAARATNWSHDPEGVLIKINKVGVRQRYHGGHIGPVNKEALAIPISPVSYGHTPRDFPGAFVLRTKSKGAYIVQYGETVGQQTGAPVTRQGGNASKRLKATLIFLFKLSSGIDQEPNPDVLPTHEEMREAAIDALRAARVGRASA